MIRKSLYLPVRHTLALSIGVGALVVAPVGCGRTNLFGLGAGGPGGGSPGGAAGVGASGGVAGVAGVGGFSGGGFAGGGFAGGGVGGGGPCETDQQCADNDACTTDRCEAGRCTYAERDDDDDGWIALECGGDDCNDKNPNVTPVSEENCTDAADNDCNGVADCNDPACELAPVCGCVPQPGGEICDSGQDEDCDTTVDCNDTDCVNTEICGCADSEAGACFNGFDDDCDGVTDCDDSDCASLAQCQCQAEPEFCADGTDDDCDLLIDCADPDCAFDSACTCIPPGIPELCGDNRDNDCDGEVDCADGDCRLDPACAECVPEVCDDGEDNNCNGVIDCADRECQFDPACAPSPEICNNSLDDDGDMLVDCDDPDCANNPLCVIKQTNCLSPRLIGGSGSYTGDTTGNSGDYKGSCGGDAGEAVFYIVLTEPSRLHIDTVGTSFDSTLYVRQGSCESGRELGCDDDSGGFEWSAALDFTILYPGTYFIFVDGFTVDPQGGPNEGPFILNVDLEPNPAERCDDGIDNDGDRYVDCADPECVDAPNCKDCNGGQPPGPEFGIGACTDGRDNDCDGVADCADSDCSASDYYVTECCNGQDQNGNQIPDDFNCACASDADCGNGEICYDHTAFACGAPCTNFFGDVCPFVAPGSTCSPATGQCEF